MTGKPVWTYSDDMDFSRQVADAAKDNLPGLKDVGVTPAEVVAFSKQIDLVDDLRKQVDVEKPELSGNVMDKDAGLDALLQLLKDLKRRVKVAFGDDSNASKTARKAFLIGDKAHSVEEVCRQAKAILDAAKKYAKQVNRRGVTPKKLAEIARLMFELRKSSTDVRTGKWKKKGLTEKFLEARARLAEMRSYLRNAAKAAFHAQPSVLSEFRAPKRSKKSPKPPEQKQ